LGDQLTANFNGQSYGGRVETGYRYAVQPMIGLTPYAALQAQSFHTPSYSQTDVTAGGFGHNAMNATDTCSELGTRFDDLTILNTMPLILRARVAWAHDWVSNPALGARCSRRCRARASSSTALRRRRTPRWRRPARRIAHDRQLVARGKIRRRVRVTFADLRRYRTLRYMW
jgi:outer membrane autotransporter protein